VPSESAPTAKRAISVQLAAYAEIMKPLKGLDRI